MRTPSRATGSLKKPAVSSRAPKHFIFCVHAHQPVGNFEQVFAEAFDKCYRPFFEVIERHPAFPLCCHLSGSLLDWLITHRPEFIESLKVLARSGRVEFLGGGYYEPIYGAIPAADLKDQIRMMRKKLEGLFGLTPQGVWLTERVWDPPLTKVLKEAGVGYTIIDDYHLEKGGVSLPTAGYYQARYRAHRLDVFSSIRPLRYLIPFRDVDDTLNYLHSLDGGSDSVLVFADDCEKFGLWPGTDTIAYGQKWLDRLLTRLEQDPGIQLTTFSGFRRHHRPRGSVTIPHASYSEMMEWAGGSFYNFFDKYPESRYMRDRMLGTSRFLKRTRPAGVSAAGAIEARKALYMAQCNCSYWHGVFGGLYLHHLRSAVFENLIKAHRLGLPAVSGRAADATDVTRLRMQSGQRLCLTQREVIWFFNPGYGAALEELDYLPMSANLMCNLQRQPEHYHRMLSPAGSAPAAPERGFSIHQFLGLKDKNLDTRLYYDQYRRLSFQDHFFAKAISQDDFAKGFFQEDGGFIGQPFRVVGPRSFKRGRIDFERKGWIVSGGRRHCVVMRKGYSAKGRSGLDVDYRLTNSGKLPLRFTVGIELNFSIGETQAAKGLDCAQVRRWIFKDSWRGLEIVLTSDFAARLMTAAIETVSGSEMGLEKTYQQLAVLLQKEIVLEPGQTKSYRVGLEIG